MKNDFKKEEYELVAIMFADIVDYTALMQRNEYLAKQYLVAFQNKLNEHVTHQKGEIVNFYGDGCLAKFKSVESALIAAKNLQIDFLTKEIKIPIRIGIHLGDVFIKDNNIFGDSVNIASRIESFGIPGSILFSEEVYDQIQNKNEFQVERLGKLKFKNDQKVRNLYALSGAPLTVPKRLKLKGKGKLEGKSFFAFSLILAILLLLFFVNNNLKNKANPDVPFQEKSIAVLPILNLNAAEENLDYLSNGLTQEIIDELAKIHAFKITPFTQSVFYNSIKKSPKEIADELAVKYLISGSIRLNNGEDLKLSIELFDPRTKIRIWNQVFEDKLINSHTLQLEIAKEIAIHLKVELSREERMELDKLNTDNGEAFKLFLQAKAEMNKLTENGYIKARTQLSRAIELDSNYAQAYTLKAWSILLSADPLINPETFNVYDLEEAGQLLDRSIHIDPNFSDTYLIRSSLKLYGYNKIQDALSDVHLALKINSWPRVPTNYCTCTMMSTFISAHNFKKALEISDISDKIDPGNSFQFWDRANIYLAQKDFQNAELNFRKAFHENQIEYFKVFLAISLYHQEKYLEVLDLYSTELQRNEIYINLSHAYLSNTYYKLGDIEKSNFHFKAIENTDTLGNTNIHKAIVHLGRDHLSKALENIQTATDQNDYGIAVMTSADPIFFVLEDDEKYNRLRASMQFVK